MSRRAQHVLQPLLFLKSRCDDFVPVRERLHDLCDVAVVFEILYREVACRIFLPDAVIFLKQQLYPVYALLQFRPVVDVDVA